MMLVQCVKGALRGPGHAGFECLVEPYLISCISLTWAGRLITICRLIHRTMYDTSWLQLFAGFNQVLFIPHTYSGSLCADNLPQFDAIQRTLAE